ncbi:MAG: YicC family protein [Clostridiales bacterium]|nr:YicC family protein [Clostridiales bacterium]
MLKSMTGYGRAEAVTGTKKITVEIKSVNHRFSDYSIKVPRQYGFLEEKVRLAVSSAVARGKIDVYVSVESVGEADKVITVNKELAGGYLAALKELCDGFGIENDVTVSVLAQFSDIFRAEPKRDDEEELWQSVKTVLDEALTAFIAMREREGGRIEADLRARISYMRLLAKRVDERSPQIVAAYKEKLYAKINELLEGREVDDARVLTEVALFADKIAVNEETVRLASHYDEFEGIISSGEPAGRRLDFLIQEINRECNTIGSKASDIETAKIVVELKGEIEKLREQIQNIE